MQKFSRQSVKCHPMVPKAPGVSESSLYLLLSVILPANFCSV